MVMLSVNNIYSYPKSLKFRENDSANLSRVPAFVNMFEDFFILQNLLELYCLAS